jgi:hypothetical protein
MSCTIFQSTPPSEWLNLLPRAVELRASSGETLSVPPSSWALALAPTEQSVADLAGVRVARAVAWDWDAWDRVLDSGRVQRGAVLIVDAAVGARLAAEQLDQVLVVTPDDDGGLVELACHRCLPLRDVERWLAVARNADRLQFEAIDAGDELAAELYEEDANEHRRLAGCAILSELDDGDSDALFEQAAAFGEEWQQAVGVVVYSDVEC